MRILVAKFNMIGDVVLSTALLANLKRHYPEARITYATYSMNHGVLEHNPDVDRLVGFERGPCNIIQKVWRNLAFFSWFIFHRHDLYICLRECSRARWLGWLSGCRRRVGTGPGPRFGNWAYTDIATSAEPHAVERDLAVLPVLGLEVLERSPRLHWDADCERRVMALLPVEPFVQVHPSSRWSYKDLPSAVVGDIVRGLVLLGMRVVLTGSESDRARATAILSCAGGGVVDLTGRLSLGELACASSRAALMIGADTAAMHIAAAVGTPVIAWFGPSLTANWGPWDGNAGHSPYQNRGGIQRMGRHVVIQSTETCVPCDRRGCEDSGRSRCLELIDAAVVLREAGRVLKLASKK